MQITDKKKAAEQLAKIKAKQAEIDARTEAVVKALRQYVVPLPVPVRSSATEVLKQYLSFDAEGRAKVNRFDSLRKQTAKAIETVKDHYNWAINTGLVSSEAKSQQTTKTVDNNGWGKSFDLTNVQVREATHTDFVSHATKKGNGNKKPAGKK